MEQLYKKSLDKRRQILLDPELIAYIEQIYKILWASRYTNRRIFVAGNGGSAATASHFVQGLRDVGLNVVSLVDCSPVITAIANDFGYDKIFMKQLEPLFQEYDILILISASGNSRNIIKACEFAQKHGGLVMGFTGFEGGKLKEMADLNIHIKTEIGEYALVEDIHMIICHIVEESLRCQGNCLMDR